MIGVPQPFDFDSAVFLFFSSPLSTSARTALSRLGSSAAVHLEQDRPTLICFWHVLWHIRWRPHSASRSKSLIAGAAGCNDSGRFPTRRPDWHLCPMPRRDEIIPAHLYCSRHLLFIICRTLSHTASTQLQPEPQEDVCCQCQTANGYHKYRKDAK